MNRRTFLQAGLSAGLAGCTQTQSESDLRLINVAITPRTSMSGLFVAQERGYFEEYGLRIEPHYVNRSPQMIALVVAGQMQAALPSINTALVNAVAKGGDVSIVAARQTMGGICGESSAIFGRAASFPNGLDDLGELRGKKVSISGLQTFTEFSLDALLASAGMGLEDVELMTLRQQDAIGALLGGRIDAFMTTDLAADSPFDPSAIIRGPRLEDVMPELQRGFIIFGPELLNDDVQLGANFLAAYLRGAADHVDGYIPEFFDELALADGADPEAEREFCRDLMVEGGVIDRASIDTFVRWAVRRGYSEIEPDPSKLVDERFVEAAQELLARQG